MLWNVVYDISGLERCKKCFRNWCQ